MALNADETTDYAQGQAAKQGVQAVVPPSLTLCPLSCQPASLPHLCLLCCLVCKELPLPQRVVQLCVGVAHLTLVDEQLKALSQTREVAVPAASQRGRAAADSSKRASTSCKPVCH
jgi:hypothetical protein